MCQYTFTCMLAFLHVWTNIVEKTKGIAYLKYVLTGEAIPLVSDTHKSSDFVSFLKILDDKYPKGDKIRIILDNHSAHTSKETQEYLNTVDGRFLA